MKKILVPTLFFTLFSGCVYAHGVETHCDPYYDYEEEYVVVHKPRVVYETVYHSHPFHPSLRVVYTHPRHLYRYGGHYYKKGRTVFYSPYKKRLHKKKRYKKKRYRKKYVYRH